MSVITQSQDIAAVWFLSGDGELYSKTSTAERDDALSHFDTDAGKVGFFFALANKEVNAGQIEAIEAFVGKLSKCMNGLNDGSGIGEGNRTIINSRLYKFCSENGLSLLEAGDELPHPFRAPDIQKRVFVFQSLNAV